jgi:hypothetical protein
MQAGRDPADPEPERCQGGDQAVTAAAVGEPGAADLPVVRAAGDELGQGELVQCRRAAAERRDHRVQQPGRDDQPGQPHRRGQALARRAAVDHPVGRERVHAADRLPVVAELPVVVVLDHDPAPLRERPAAARVQGHAQRELVRGREQGGVGTGRRGGHGAVTVQRQRAQVQARGRDDVAMLLVAVLLDGHHARAVRAQRPPDRAEAVREPGTDHDISGFGGHAAHPGQVLGQHGAQHREPARIAVAEDSVGGGGQRLTGGGQPRAAREPGHVGLPRAQIVAVPGRGGRGDGGAGRDGAAGRDRGAGAGPRAEPPLGHQLAVDLRDRVARDAEVGGQHAGGRQPGAGSQPAGPDRVTQRCL